MVSRETLTTNTIRFNKINSMKCELITFGGGWLKS